MTAHHAEEICLIGVHKLAIAVIESHARSITRIYEFNVVITDPDTCCKIVKIRHCHGVLDVILGVFTRVYIAGHYQPDALIRSEVIFAEIVVVSEVAAAEINAQNICLFIVCRCGGKTLPHG